MPAIADLTDLMAFSDLLKAVRQDLPGTEAHNVRYALQRSRIEPVAKVATAGLYHRDCVQLIISTMRRCRRGRQF